MRRSVGNGLLLVCLGLIAPVAAVESASRLLPGLLPAPLRMIDHVYEARQAWEDMMTKDPYLGFKLRPGLDFEFPSEGRRVRVRTVDYGLGDIGFRDLGTRPPFEIVAVGDSFAFCDDAPAESCWVRRLADATGRSAATLGVNGYSSLAEARMLKRYGPVFRPKVVLLSVFLNDFKDNVSFEEWLEAGTDDFWLWMRRRRRSALADTLTRVSVVYRLVDGAAHFRRHPVTRYHDGSIEFVFKSEPWWRNLVERPRSRRGWKLMQEGFAQAARAADEIGARLVVLLFPFKEQVYWDRLKNSFPGLDHMDVDGPFKMVGDYWAERDVPYCDLTQGFRRGAREGKQLYLKVSGHWNDAGHALAADLVVSCLRRHRIIEDTAEASTWGSSAGNTSFLDRGLITGGSQGMLGCSRGG